MAFCTNCGQQIQDNSRFCTGCGHPVGTENTAQAHASGMSTVKDIQNFYRNTLQFAEKYVQQYSPGINMLVNALFPGEIIEFASHCVIGSLKNGIHAEIATTNRRFLIAKTPGGSLHLNEALKGIRGNQVESYAYDNFSGITSRNGLLIGNIDIDFIQGSISIGVDRKWTEIVYKGLSASFYQHTGGGF